MRALLDTVASLYESLLKRSEAERQFHPALATDRTRCALSDLLPMCRFEGGLIEFEKAREPDPLLATLVFTACAT